MRPIWDHNYHFRMRRPAGSGDCESQEPPAHSEGCSKGDLAYWFSDAVLHAKPPKPKPPMTLAQLTAACKRVLLAP